MTAGELLDRGVARGDFPAAVLLAAQGGQPVIHRAAGAARLDTLFDLASLTKPLATTAVVMRLCQRGELSLDRPVYRDLPEFARTETRTVTVRHLLLHNSGLPAWQPFFERTGGRDPNRRRRLIRRMVARTPLCARPGQLTCYSDLGFILLEWLLQRRTNLRLDRLAAREVFEPLGLDRTRFFKYFQADRKQVPPAGWTIAPTELCPWRGRRLLAEVHDDNAWSMGGVAGHAGLFATAHDLHLLVRELCAAFHGRGSLFSRAVVRRFWRPLAGTSRTLGWDRPSGPRPSAGRHFPPESVGHLGFTGTSVWIHPPSQTWVILLTNRVYHGREPNPMPALRPKIHDAVMRDL